MRRASPGQISLILIYLIIITLNLAFKPFPPEECVYWVAPSPSGSDLHPGTITLPWASLEHAAASVRDDECTVWFQDGTYTGSNRIKRRFETYTRFAAVNPYQVVFQDAGPVVSISGGSHIILEGFVFQHSGPEASPVVVQVHRRDDIWAEYIVFHNNIFRDSYNDDLLKIYNGSRFVMVSNNLFYNQGASDQHIDVNSVTDVTIQENIFFNDFAASGRSVENDTKHYIVIKDSNEGEDSLLGSERILVQQNIFLNWQGGPGESFVQVGNDGKPYFEARYITIQNNLFLGNSPILIGAAFGVSGAKNVQFVNNSVSGDLPSRSYAARIDIKGENPKNENITFCNNIWSDPTGTMGRGTPEEGDRNEFSDGNPEYTINLLLDYNQYWNGADVIPDGDLVSPLRDDHHRLIEDPHLNTDFADLMLPVWSATGFPSGNKLIKEEILRLAQNYGLIAQRGSALWRENAGCAPASDNRQYIHGFFPGFEAGRGAAWFSSMLSPLALSMRDKQSDRAIIQ